LSSKKKQTFIAMMGVTFGISMFITMISFMTGVNEFLLELTLNDTPHIRIFNPLELRNELIIESENVDEIIVLHHQKPKDELPRIKDGLQIAEEIRAVPEVSGVLAQVSTQAFINNGPIKIPGMVVGTDILQEERLYNISDKMIEGEINNLLTYRDGIMLGVGLAEKTSAKIGDRISLTAPNGNTFFFRVVGIFAFGLGAIDDSRAYTTVSSAQKLLGVDAAYVTEIQTKLYDYNQASQVSDYLFSAYGYKTEDWETANEAIVVGEIIRNSMTYIISFTMLMVAGFGIYNIMNMNIINKMKDIAILKATGFEGRDVRMIFILQSLFIGITGGVLGLLLGYIFSLGINQIPCPKTGFITIDTFPVNFKLEHYLLGIFFGLITTIFAGWFPARKASGVDPVEIIRG